jgi:hypothetical protein
LVQLMAEFLIAIANFAEALSIQEREGLRR